VPSPRNRAALVYKLVSVPTARTTCLPFEWHPSSAFSWGKVLFS